ncbi:RNA polymerase sigma factor [Clostridium sp.]|uniref:RNA polymerase sigma factor n=1 Tax=Clostridium sp. TaxID=1506 RepID=UPI003D6D52D6
MEKHSLFRSDKILDEIYKRNVNRVYRLCYMYLKNTTDAEDAVQSVFLKLIKSNITFNDHEHEKAWLIITSKNYCKDVFKSFWRSHRVAAYSLPEILNNQKQPGEVMEKLLALPEKYKTVLYLYYFENYRVKDISRLLNRNESTIQTHLAKGRERLKIDLGGNFYE